MQHTHVHTQTQTHIFLSSNLRLLYCTARCPHFRRACYVPWGQQWWLCWWWSLRGSQRLRARGAGVRSLGSSWRTAAGRGSPPGHPWPAGPCSVPDSLIGLCSLGKEQTGGEGTKKMLWWEHLHKFGFYETGIAVSNGSNGLIGNQLSSAFTLTASTSLHVYSSQYGNLVQVLKATDILAFN